MMRDKGQIDLSWGPYDLRCNVDAGASLCSLTYHGLELLRTGEGTSVLESASFPLLPFANRIAGNGFDFDGRHISLTPNHPTDPEEFVLHGFGWLHPWHIDQLANDRVVLTYEQRPGEWPWHFKARHLLELGNDGLRMELSVRNLSENSMPIGLGFHPFFPRPEGTILRSAHRGERGHDGSIDHHAEPRDWLEGKTVGDRIVDTTYVHRHGAITIEWPDRKLGVRLCASADLPHTHIYVPDGTDFFCVEPVSHLPEAFATGDEGIGFRTLDPEQEWSAWMQIAAYSPGSP